MVAKFYKGQSVGVECGGKVRRFLLKNLELVSDSNPGTSFKVNDRVIVVSPTSDWKGRIAVVTKVTLSQVRVRLFNEPDGQTRGFSPANLRRVLDELEPRGAVVPTENAGDAADMKPRAAQWTQVLALTF